MTRPILVFVEDQAQADIVAATAEPPAATTIVAMTAEASEALVRRGIAHVPVGHVADLRRLTPGMHTTLMAACCSLCKALDDRLRDAFPFFAADGPGLLTAQVYNIQYAMTAHFTRFFLMREAIRTLRPAECRFQPECINTWFYGQGYEENPWTSSLKQWLVEHRIGWDSVAGAPAPDSVPSGG